MKNLATNQSWLLPLLFLWVLSGCDDNFEAINTDPNAFSEVPAHFFLPGSILSMANAENDYFDGYLYPSSWIQHTALVSWDQPGNYFYEKGRSSLWNNLYRGPLVDLDLMIAQAEEEENQSLKAVGMILHAYGFSLLVNAFGDVPYSESFRVDEGINQPVYDGQSTIYEAILAQLRQADALLDGVTSIDIDRDYDILYRGDGLKWRKFANSLRFRLLMHISAITDVASELSGISPLFESSDDNAIYQYPGDIEGAIYSPAQAIGPEATDQGHRMASPLVDRMTATNDPRLPLYALVSEDGGTYAGVQPGIYFVEDDVFSGINPAGFTRDATITFMDYSELLFLQAEAAERGLITGDVTTFLSDAIGWNMTRRGVVSDAIIDYVANVLSDGTDLEEIYMEKWVSMFGRGMQAWTDYRRTGMPGLSPVPGGIVNVIPRRFSYPENEQATNSVNMQAAAAKLSNGDNLDSQLIWTIH